MPRASSAEMADIMVENAVATFALPFGVGLNFLINGRDYIIPMVVEEPSVIAAATHSAPVPATSGPMPDTRPPAPRLATSAPRSSGRKVSGPRFETTTTGRSTSGRHYGTARGARHETIGQTAGNASGRRPGQDARHRQRRARPARQRCRRESAT